MVAKHILIVDDKSRVAFFLSQTLERLNQSYCVSVTHSGEEAMEILGSSAVDLLITDLCMPGINGLELIRWVRASSPHTHAILITAHDNDEAKEEIHCLDACRYLTKPFNVDEFIQLVQEALHDATIGQPDPVALPDESFKALDQQLDDLRHEIGALCIFMADMRGRHLAEVGDSTGFDAPALLSLLAGGFTVSGKLARQFGSGRAINLNLHEGSRYDIYSISVGDNLFLAIIYDRRVQASRVGIVWLYARRAVERLLSTLQGREEPLPPPPLPEQEEPLPGRQPRRKKHRRKATDEEQLSSGVPGDSTPKGPPFRGAPEEKHSDEDEPQRELIDIETAIARGIIPADLGWS